METTFVGLDQEGIYCFPFPNSQNVSCFKDSSYRLVHKIFLSSLLLMSLFAACGNLLVIVSICHFKQLHTPTNFIILSLAVTDFLIGVVIMPMECVRLLDVCWNSGVIFCLFLNSVIYFLISVSLGSILLIAIDRYFAVCDPLHYSSNISASKTLLYVSLVWFLSLLYNLTMFVIASFTQTTEQFVCVEECVVTINLTLLAVDMVITFIFPCVIMLFVYFNILKVALKQAHQISATANDKMIQKEQGKNRKSQLKATKTVGIVVTFYLLCWIPSYIALLIRDKISNSTIVIKSLLYLFYFNSCINPIIYALFYPWFKKSFKLILTFKVLDSASSLFNLFSELH